MTAPPVVTSHRRGASVWLIPVVRGRRAPWDEVAAQAMDVEAGERVAAGVTTHVHEWNPLDDTSVVRELAGRSASGLDPGVLLEVRRPLSYEGMRSYIGRMRVPSRFVARSVWFESRNEQEHWHRLLMTRDVVEMATQPLRFTWAFPGGLRTHVPDALVTCADGRTVLIDVTRRDRLADPAMAAVVTMTQRTARHLGWSYQVLTELSDQEVRNVSALWSCRGLDGPAEELLRRARTLPRSVQVLPAARELGGGPPNLAAVWQLVAHRFLAVDFAKPLRADSLLHRTDGGGRR